MVSSRQFEAALRQLPVPGGRQLDFLHFHEKAKARAVTATMLGDRAGYKSYRPINLLYGTLAKQIGEKLVIPHQGLALLCDFFKPGEITNEQWVLIMRPEFADGLKRAKWL